MGAIRRGVRTGLTLVELLVVLAIIGILLAFLIPAVQKVRSAALHTESANNVKQICLAVHSYQNNQRYFPRINGFNPTTSAFEYSFFVGLLPYIEQDSIYNAFKQTFANSGGISDAFRVPVFVSPLDPTAPWAVMSYAANGSVFNRRRSSFNTIADGSSNTVALAEHYSYGCGGFVFTWTQADMTDFNIPGVPESRRATFADQKMGDVVPVTNALQSGPSIAGVTFQVAPKVADCNPRLAQALSNRGMLTGLVDGSVRTLAPSISEATYWGLLTPNGGEVLGSDW